MIHILNTCLATGDDWSHSSQELDKCESIRLTQGPNFNLVLFPLHTDLGSLFIIAVNSIASFVCATLAVDHYRLQCWCDPNSIKVSTKS